MAVIVRQLPEEVAVKLVGALVEKLGGSVTLTMKDIDNLGGKMLVRHDHPWDAEVTFRVMEDVHASNSSLSRKGDDDER
jgi:hypothetical protein